MVRRKPKPKREEVSRVFSQPGSSWSRWYTALLPKAPNRSPMYEKREEGDDVVIYKEIRNRFVGRAGYDDGIYELSVLKKGKPRYVVYIGAAHRKGPGSISERILEYCTSGSHKDKLINKAMSRGYKLLARARNIHGSREFVYQCEDSYLERYDYAWNKRKNGRIRKSVPPR